MRECKLVAINNGNLFKKGFEIDNVFYKDEKIFDKNGEIMIELNHQETFDIMGTFFKVVYL